MQLCFISHVSFFIRDGHYVCTPGFVKLVEMVAPLYDQVELCAPLFPGALPGGEGDILDVPNVTVCPLPPYFRRWEHVAFMHPFRLMHCLWPHVKRSDAVLINLPNYLAFLAWKVCMLQRKPFGVRIAGNWPKLLRQAFARRRIPVVGHVVAALHQLALYAVIHTSNVTLANCLEIVEESGHHHPQLQLVISSTIHESAIAPNIADNGNAVPRILFVGRLLGGKGLSELFTAARDLKAQGLAFRVVVAGEGNWRAEFEREVRDLGIEDVVEFVGWIGANDLPALYRRCDVFALTSHSEGMPKVVIEAMAHGLPVIATRVGSVPAVVEQGKTGLIIPPADAGALREALRQMILDPILRRQMAEAGLKRVRLFTMEAERRCVGDAFRKFGLLPHEPQEGCGAP